MSVGDVVLFRLDDGARASRKLRPALVVAELPGYFPAFLLCGISSRTDRALDGWDVPMGPEQAEFDATGLKAPSVIRPSWLVSVPQDAELRPVGKAPAETVATVRERIRSALTETANR